MAQIFLFPRYAKSGLLGTENRAGGGDGLNLSTVSQQNKRKC